MNNQYKNFKWSGTTSFENQKFVDFDFSESDFNDVFFIGSKFQNCIFQKGKPGDLAFFNCSFKNCKFNNFDFRRMVIGAEGGLFEECIFARCNFTGILFGYPHFTKCIFDHCKLKNTNFNDASFELTKFIGKIEDTTFNGIYHEKPTGFKPIDNVDFSEATFGDFVTFENCDLSNSTPPNEKAFATLLYKIREGHPHILSTGSRDRIIIKDT